MYLILEQNRVVGYVEGNLREYEIKNNYIEISYEKEKELFTPKSKSIGALFENNDFVFDEIYEEIQISSTPRFFTPPIESESVQIDEQGRVIPSRVTRRQGKQALLLANLLDLVQPAIDAIPDTTQRGLAQIYWDDAQEFERNNPVLNQLAEGLGLTQEDLNNLFVQAATL